MKPPKMVYTFYFIIIDAIILHHATCFLSNYHFTFIKALKKSVSNPCKKCNEYFIKDIKIGASSSEVIINDDIKKSKIKFESDHMEVFIEDTDAYGVMYNANYIRCYERALHLTTVGERSNHWEEPYKSNSILNNPEWFVISVTDQKFRGSPVLGSKFVVVGELLVENNYDYSPDNNVETWAVKLICPESQAVYNEALVTISEPYTFLEMNTLVFKKPPIFIQQPKQLLHEITLVPYRDEFDRFSSTHIPLRNVLNLFERSRTILLGGPNSLQKLQDEDNIMFVVSSISNLSLINLYHSIDDENSDITRPHKDENNHIQCQAGKDVSVKNIINVKRNGMILEFYHTLLVPLSWRDTESNAVITKRRRLAQGVVTVVAIDKHSRRPTSKLPPHLMESIQTLTTVKNE